MYYTKTLTMAMSVAFDALEEFAVELVTVELAVVELPFMIQSDKQRLPRNQILVY